ncbi:hypothetical protein ACFT54_10150 [Streptomyces cinereoruber]|uniref:hypothetical protein n=1 Tax=Streptomyces cinereoruber TaxID=67260 RepID=UPI00362E736D
MAAGTLTASVSRYTSRKITGKGPGDQAWQYRAFDMYHQVPEVRFAASWISNAMSGARLFAGRYDDEGKIVPAPAGHRAAEIVSQIAGGPDGQAKLLGAFGRHLTVPGEGWIVVRPNDQVLSPYSPEDGHDWRVLSVKEVRRQSGKMTAEIDGDEIVIPAGNDEKMDPDGPVALRVWEPDPERAIEADSPVRASLELLEELVLLNAAVKAIARSRITGRGILFVPKGTRFPTAPGQDSAQDDLIEILMTVSETAIRDPDSAAATVPIVLEVPAEAIEAFKHLTFESEFDDLAIKLREEAIRRFATGLEIPAEILLGLGDVNHWGAWALTSEAIRLGIEPKLGTVAGALTQQWLRPILEAESVEDWHRWLVWYDTAPLRVRTNRSETALQAHDRGVISDAALRRETGFDESDAPTAEELARRNPAPQENPETPEDDEENPVPQTPTRPTLPVDESEAPPRTLDGLDASGRPRQLPEAVVATADVLIWAALSAVGRRVKNSSACPRSERAKVSGVALDRIHTIVPVEADQIDRLGLLDGAWDRVPEIAGRYGMSPDCMAASLEEYVRALIAARIEHEYRDVPTVLASCYEVAA